MAATVTPDAVEKTVVEALPQFGVDESQISRDATFEELDVDSLELETVVHVPRNASLLTRFLYDMEHCN